MAYRKSVDMRSLVYAALALVLTVGLHFLSTVVAAIDSSWLLWQIPVFLVGFLAGPLWGPIAAVLSVLLITAFGGGFDPLLLRRLAEVSVYAYASAQFCRFLPKHPFCIWISLLSAQFFGRLAWGVMYHLLTIFNPSLGAFHWTAITSSTVAGYELGILLQLIFVPLIFLALRKARLVSRY